MTECKKRGGLPMTSGFYLYQKMIAKDILIRLTLDIFVV